MSTMRFKNNLEPETVADIDQAKDCGPYAVQAGKHRFATQGRKDLLDWGEHRHWICEYHEGFDAGVSIMKQ